MKNEIKKHIFKNQIRKILNILFISSLIVLTEAKQNIFAQQVKLKYSKGKATSVNLYCKGHINPDGNCKSYIGFADSEIAPGKHADYCGRLPYITDCITANVYQHTFLDGSVMYSISSDPSHFEKTANNFTLDIMDLLKAMPEIGVSRVDPNLIEY